MVGRGTDPASKPMTKADIMTVLGAGMAVGLVAFILVASQVPNVPVLGRNFRSYLETMRLLAARHLWEVTANLKFSRKEILIWRKGSS